MVLGNLFTNFLVKYIFSLFNQESNKKRNTLCGRLRNFLTFILKMFYFNIFSFRPSMYPKVFFQTNWNCWTFFALVFQRFRIFRAYHLYGKVGTKKNFHIFSNVISFYFNLVTTTQCVYTGCRLQMRYLLYQEKKNNY